MPAPTTYTEETLAEYMLATLKQVATDLGWTSTDPNTGNYREPVHTVEVALGVTDIADTAAPVELIRLQADVAVWQEAVEAYTTAYYIGGLQRSLHREQLWDHARAMLNDAKAALASYQRRQDQQDEGTRGAVPSSGVVKLKPVW